MNIRLNFDPCVGRLLLIPLVVGLSACAVYEQRLAALPDGQAKNLGLALGSDAFNTEAGLARIHGGMHFTYATVAGEELGKRVAQWVASRHFGRQE